MDELSEDELVVLLFSVAGAVGFLLHWIRMMVRPSALGTSPRLWRVMLFLLALMGLAVIGFALVRWADAEVKAHAVYIIMFVLLGATWLEGVTLSMPLLGLRLSGDAIERRNSAASVAAGGALLGAALVFGGANIGGGATIWSTILPAFMATVTWLAAWAVAEILSGISEAIAIDRDAASGWRLAGFLVAAGLVLGRAVAGDYHFAEQTVRDFVRQGWPVLLGVAAVVGAQKWARATPAQPCPPILARGILPAAVMVLMAAGYVAALGWWEGKR